MPRGRLPVAGRRRARGRGLRGPRGRRRMSRTHVTAVMEEYLRAILDLGMAGRPVIGRRLADWLAVAPSTVTATLQRMGDQGLVSLTGRKEGILSKEGA